ncbi:hypothetical protein RG836_26460 [Pseudomonas sp. SZMC_28357]|uniref:hypothetical protein n=1 Tax=Pseudomonas sp. SZMC_28357 TaxID=3074380 RepID=UPI002870ED2C|nr:hypothetical protein [Pseudomonas sp. SZMC_28357]MDR9754993.1 hypothetical protein [Pseudomonas sp. SZMC_28357]
MKVVCKINNLSGITDAGTLSRLRRYISRSDGQLDLEVGKEYIVYGIQFWDNCPWLYLCLEDDEEYPKPYAVDFFTTSNDRLSQYWKMSHSTNNGAENFSALVVEPWSKDHGFYERLIDGDIEATLEFSRYRKLMDAENQERQG